MPINLINLCTKRHNEFLIVPQLVEKAIFDFYASCGSTHSIEFALQIHKFREHVSRNLYKGRKNVSAGRGFSSRFARKRGFEREAVRKTKFFDSLRHNEFLIVPFRTLQFFLADNHTDQRIKFIIVRGRLSGGSIPALSITLSIHAILRPSFSMTSTPSISCTASPLSAPCTAFQ